ncbi:HAMP domain-containing sensor histidine kinase [[Flexibacter] sp. ATCC 35208]|uniref:sensor histidine kinase n=1 Tax=[Flexibacter] sp. ATCC 35208 TaxID=1936242 RepID=UPI0009CEC61B|nr:HAMP domain-containing sensor histidine kinase [[Flexibacter] sp. ATCC 35208]OMP74708.1 hypothetical protein BW716_33940 [[Flexibacter] sp. ATCC 35208]
MPISLESNTITTLPPAALAPQSTPQSIELFLGMFAHELRTQVAGTIQVCRYIREGSMSEAFFQALETTTLDTLHILDNMLATVKFHNGKLDITPAYCQIDFRSWITPVIRQQERTAALQQKDICLILHPSLENIQVTTDPVKLGQILQNLLSNALKYSHPGTVITVKCRLESDVICLQVINQGMEIPPEKASRLFIPYERLDNGLAGTGLGLFLSAQYAQALSGALAVQSEQGNTVFTLTLPIYR